MSNRLQGKLAVITGRRQSELDMAVAWDKATAPFKAFAELAASRKPTKATRV